MPIFSLRFFSLFHFHPIFLLVSLFLYFLPAYLARNQPNFTGILLLNLLAGWTFIGWIVALVWTLSPEPQPQAAPAQPATTALPQAAAEAVFFCNTCGKPCAVGARFCSSCGATLPAMHR